MDINCDMGESFGLYKMGDDAAVMPFLTHANVACGFHASDPNHMRDTVSLAKKHGVKIGAHFSLPDLAGFGRREMKISRDELANIIAYQVGALKAFLDMAEAPLSHFKPHGSLYGMAARQEHVAHAVADIGEYYQVPVFGFAGTLHEKIYTERGLTFVPEFYADLEYDSNGGLLITREHGHADPDQTARRCLRAINEGLVTSVDGTDVPVRMQTICVHSDTPNAVDVVRTLYRALRDAPEPAVDQPS